MRNVNAVFALNLAYLTSPHAQVTFFAPLLHSPKPQLYVHNSRPSTPQHRLIGISAQHKCSPRAHMITRHIQPLELNPARPLDYA